MVLSITRSLSSPRFTPIYTYVQCTSIADITAETIPTSDTLYKVCSLGEL